MRELLYTWSSTNLMVLVPKKRGPGFLRVPYGHHADAGLDAVEQIAQCDIFGLDGHLEFEFGHNVRHLALSNAEHAARMKDFETKVIAALEKHYGTPSRAVGADEFWAAHPILR